MSKVVIIIDDVKYEAVKSEDSNRCTKCAFIEECVNNDCYCGFMSKAMDDKYFVKVENKGT